MFGRENVYATVNSFNVRVKDEREQDRNHLVEATFEVPLSFELMDEINPKIAKDLFDTSKGEHTPKPELNTVGLNLAPEQQLVILRNHPDLDPEVRIASAILRKIMVRKGEGNTWLLVFTITWTLGDPKEVVVIIQRLKQGAYLTMQPQEPKLALEDPPAQPAEQQQAALVDQGGNVTSITAGKKRGRKGKQTPEQIAADQVAAGREALPDPVDEPAAADEDDGGGPGGIPVH